MAGIPDHPTKVTALLLKWGHGDEAALDQLIPLVHRELRMIARRYMARERADHSLQATALVNEAYLRLVDGPQVGWQDRAHFFAVAGRIMRRILVDHARAHLSQKRGGQVAKVQFDDELPVARRSASRSHRAGRRARSTGEVRRAQEPCHRVTVLRRD